MAAWGGLQWPHAMAEAEAFVCPVEVCYLTLCQVMLDYTRLGYVVLRCVMLCYVVLCCLRCLLSLIVSYGDVFTSCDSSPQLDCDQLAAWWIRDLQPMGHGFKPCAEYLGATG